MSLSDSDGDPILVRPEDVRDFNPDNILPLPAKDLADITKWLQPTPYDFERSEYSRHRASHLLGTGASLTSTQVYQQWHSGDNGTLWIKGIPGSGKSVMAASIIEELQEIDVPVFYFFFRQIIDANHKPIVALRDWLCQLLDRSPQLQVKLQKYLKERRALDSLSPTDLWSDLKMALCGFPKAYCVTDGLDKMDTGNDDFLKGLVDLGRWRPENIKVLMTSRPTTSLETSLRSFATPQVRLEERQVDLDIVKYVQYKLRSSSIAKEDWSDIQEAIPGRANGLFLYAKMSMDVLLEPGADVQEVLNALPMDLNAMYDELLREHARRSKVPFELQLLILQFVTHATRPLRLLETAEMLNTNSGGNRTLKETKDLVRAACGPLLEILPDETISIIHRSFTEFLKGYTRSDSSSHFEYPIFDAGLTNLRLAEACLGYLRAGCLDIEIIKIRPRESPRDFLDRKERMERELRLQFPFLEYASRNWYKHARRAEASGENMELFHQTLEFFAETHRYNVWLNLTRISWEIDGIKPLHVAAQTGLAQFAKHILSKGGVMDLKSDLLAMELAASYDHGDVIQVLVNHGAHPDFELREGLKPMHLAARGHLTPKTRENDPVGGRVVGAVGAPGRRTIGETPLMYACHVGHLDTVAEFVPKLTNVEDLYKALHWAAEKGRASIVDLILQQPGVDVNAKLQGDTALFAACKSADLKTIEILIKAGADPTLFCANAPGDSGYTPRGLSFTSFLPKEKADSKAGCGYTALHALCNNPGHLDGAPSQRAECMIALLKAGANVHAITPGGSTALHYAFGSSIKSVFEPSIELIRSLLDAGADPAAEDDAGETALHHSTKLFRDEALSLLLESGKVDINKPRAKDGMTPLLCRIGHSDDRKIIGFLAYKPDVNATDFQGNAPLHLALKQRHPCRKVIDALLAAGADPNLRNQAVNTPLLEMANDIDQGLIRSLLSAGADLEVRNNKGQSVLFAQLSSWRGLQEGSKMLDHLASQGACLDTRDYKGRTLWHCAINSLATITRLQFLGVDPLVSDYGGNTPLDEVVTNKALSNKGKVLERLLDIGMNVNQRNYQGRTILHAVCLRDDFTEHQYTILDYVLWQCECLTVRDSEGIQALHIAATISEPFFHKLLNAGADICAATHDRMTVLHLAARARQSGIVDMILSRTTSLSEKARLKFVNSQDEEGRTALHYACRSGRPETVKSLLEAGADCNALDIHEQSPFALCGEFEKEASLWYRQIPGLRSRPNRGLNAAGLTLKDDTRPFPDRDDNDTEPTFGRLISEHDTTRVAEIINLLVEHGANLKSDYISLKAAWRNAAQPQYGYTISCLPPLRSRNQFPQPIIHTESYSPYEVPDPDWQLKISLAITCRNAMKDDLEKSERPENKNEKKLSQEDIASLRQCSGEKVLALRYYDLFAKLTGGSDSFNVADGHGSTPLNMLARWGFVEILHRVCTREISTQLDVTWAHNPDESDLQKCHKPLIISACERQLPNMDVLKLVVEHFGAKINAKPIERIYRDGKHLPTISRGVLHDLAAGRFWWHVDKALPYLIQMGADINIRNRDGETSLIVALKSRHPFSKEAFEVLIKAGADVNVADNAGNTCLSGAGDDLNIIKLLITHGAEVSPSAILSALKLEKVDMLQVLLSQSGQSILRQPLPTQISYRNTRVHLKTVGAGTLPLLYAAAYRANSKSMGPNSNVVIRKRLVDVMLKYGAGPYATFPTQQYLPIHHGVPVTEEPTELPVKNATIIHELLSGGHIVEPFFNLPSLDTEHRDEKAAP